MQIKEVVSAQKERLQTILSPQERALGEIIFNNGLREVMNRLYSPHPDGYCGDEDNGQTSAWYVFTAMGFYPVAPATDEYVIGAPLFKKITVSLENGKTIEIDAPENNAENRYVQAIQMNGTEYGKNYFDFSELMNGAKISFKMGKQPNRNRGTGEAAFPYSFSNEYNK